MSRLVSSRPAPAGAVPLEAGLNVAAAPGTTSRDDYLSKVAKYIPVEFIGAYVFFQKLLRFQSGEQHGPNFYIQIASICGFTLVLWVLIPFYFRYHGKKENKAWQTQAVISSIAFPIWIYAVGGSLLSGVGELFGVGGYPYEIINATFLPGGALALFSVISGFFDQ